jgi:hypothetical protein
VGDRQEQAAGDVEHVRESLAHVDGVLVEEQGLIVSSSVSRRR